MAGQADVILTVYEKEKLNLSKKYPDFSNGLLESMAYDAIGPHLASDKYSVTTTLDNLFRYFILNNIGPATLISRLEEMGYKIVQPDKDKNAIIVERDTDKGKLAFSFEFRQQDSILTVPETQPDPEAIVLLKELYSKFVVKQKEPIRSRIHGEDVSN